MSTFKSKTSVFKGYPIISIYEFDEEGFQKYKKPAITVGVKKAQALLDQIDELKKFVEENLSQQETELLVDQEIQKILNGDTNGAS